MPKTQLMSDGLGSGTRNRLVRRGTGRESVEVLD